MTAGSAGRCRPAAAAAARAAATEGRPSPPVDLEATGRPIRLFAYPYGLWNQAALPDLHAAGYQAAFQLGQPQDRRQPLLTIRHMIAPSGSDGSTLLRHLRTHA